MSSLLYGQDASIARWVALHIPHVGEAGFHSPVAAIGVVSDETILAGVVFHDYQPDFGTMQLSMAAVNPMWARRENIAGLLAYPFIQLGVFKCWIACPSDGQHALDTWDHIGFKREAILAHQFGRKRHAIMMRMMKPDFYRLFGDIYPSSAHVSRRRENKEFVS